MNFITYLVSLGLIAVACSSPISLNSKCPADCEETDRFQHTDFRHVSDLKDSSVAPWTYNTDSEDGREPCSIQRAVCQDDCKIDEMVPKPIFLEISVYKMPDDRNSTNWCKCPYMLPVGCTCIYKTATE